MQQIKNLQYKIKQDLEFVMASEQKNIDEILNTMKDRPIPENGFKSVDEAFVADYDPICTNMQRLQKHVAVPWLQIRFYRLGFA